MIEYVFLGRPRNQPWPDTLEIPRGDPKAILRAFILGLGRTLCLVFFTTVQVFVHGFKSPNWVTALLLVACISLILSAVGQVRTFVAKFSAETFFVRMDKSGLVRLLPMRQAWAWRDIAACACSNDYGRTVLRVFLRGKTNRTIDIDFALAARPKHALDEAMVACAAWIVAARDPSETDSPTRDFVVKPANPRPWQSVSSKPSMRILVLAVISLMVVVGIAVFGRPVREEPPMPVDGRPEQKVLFLGNSRIAVNDLPRMVRDIADAAHSPIRYDIHMRAWSAATLEEHYYNGGDRTALRKPWDLVVLQPQSAAFMGDGAARDTANYGERLIRTAKAGGSQVAVMANWALGPSFFSGDAREANAAAKSYAETTERDTHALAGRAGAGVIDLDGAFAEAAEKMPEVELTSDGNHPSHAGTYLAALVIYGYLSHADMPDISWRPYDMSRATAMKLKEIATRYMR